VPDTIFLFQPTPDSYNKSFNSNKMIITCQWPELMLWKGNKYIIFGDRIELGVPGTGYNEKNTFQLKSYDMRLPFNSIPVNSDLEYTTEILFSKTNTEIINIKPLIIEAELIPIEGSGGIMTYNLTQTYKYNDISQYNYFSTKSDIVNLYQQWCNDTLDVLKKTIK